MARDDADEGRRDAPWDFDLPDLGASATPEHHHRRRQPSGDSSAGAPRPPRRRHPADEPLDFEALDADPIDQDDEQLVPHSAADLSTHGPGSTGPALPDEVSEDPHETGSEASGTFAVGPSPRRAPEHDDDLLPSWATGRPARRRSADRGQQPSQQDRPSGRQAQHGRDDADRGDGRRDVPLEEPHPAARDDDRRAHAQHDDRHPQDDGDAYDDRHDDEYIDRYDDDRAAYDEWDDDWDDERDRADAVPLRRRLPADPRRLTRVLVPVALVLLVIALVVWILNGLSGGEEESLEEDPAVAAEPSEDPFEGFSARPEDQTTDGVSGPAARACGDALSLEASTDEQTYAEDQDPLLIMELENTGEDPCMVNAGTARMDFSVVSGSDTVFDSQHCQIEGQDRPIELEPGETQSARMEWGRQRSAPGCPEDTEEAAPGGYELEVSLGETSGGPAGFTLEGGSEG